MLLFTCIALLLAIFDIGSDWYALSQFVGYKTSKTDDQQTIALGVICAVSTILFGFEIYTSVRAIRILRNALSTDTEIDPKEEKTLEYWREMVTFFQLIIEDFPITIIMYIVFRHSSCGLFHEIFEDGFVGNLVLLAAFLSSLWKAVSTFGYCCCGGYKNIRCSRKCCCCCCRCMRGVIAILLMGFSAYLFFTFNREGTKYRSDCIRPV